jgi:hypothetical protein
MAADSEIAVYTTKLMAGTDAAPFLSYLRRLGSLSAVAVTIALLARADFSVAIQQVSRKPFAGQWRPLVQLAEGFPKVATATECAIGKSISILSMLHANGNGPSAAI